MAKQVSKKVNNSKAVKKSKKVSVLNKTKTKQALKSSPKAAPSKFSKMAKGKKSVKKIAKPLNKKLIKPSVKKIGKSLSKKAVKKPEKKLFLSKVVLEKPALSKLVKIKDENYMNALQQAHFREMLLNWKRQLLGEMERTVHHMQDEAANFPDPNDRATVEEEFSLELRTRDRERKLIKKIDEALARLDNQEYGYCEACGIEIGIQRLEARPTATLCIDCKTIDEIREKHFS